MIKLIAIDVDGTLLPESQTVSRETMFTLKKAIKSGIYVVITSGRCYQAGAKLQKDLGLEGQPMVLQNGALTVMPGEELRINKTIPLDTVKRFYIESIRQGWSSSFAFGSCSKVYMNTHDQFGLKVMHELNMADPEYAPDFATIKSYCQQEELPNKILVDCPNLRQTKKTYRDIQMDFWKDMNIFLSGDRFIDIAPFGVTKGNGLAQIMDKLGISSYEVMSIGDGENDMSMLDLAAYPVAMGNALDRVKKKAKYITDTNENEGVRKAIEKIAFAAR